MTAKMAQCLSCSTYFHFGSMRISVISKSQESTKLRQPRTIQVFVSLFCLYFLDLIPVDWAEISHHEQTTKFVPVTKPARAHMMGQSVSQMTIARPYHSGGNSICVTRSATDMRVLQWLPLSFQRGLTFCVRMEWDSCLPEVYFSHLPATWPLFFHFSSRRTKRSLLD